MMLAINRAGYSFSWRELRQMPLSKFLKYHAIATEFFRQQEEKNKEAVTNT